MKRKSGPNLLFFRNFLRHPSRVGWLLPSSSFVVGSVLNAVSWEHSRCIVEYGPGTGTFTKSILRRMRPDAQLFGFEIDPSFCDFLQADISDPRFHLVRQSAAEVDRVLRQFQVSKVDCIISGVPFKPLPHRLRVEIVKKTRSILSPGGKFLVYQFSSIVRTYLRESFPQVREATEFRNIVPTRIFFCEA